MHYAPTGPLNQAKLTAAVAAHAGLTAEQAKAAVSSLLDIVVATTAAGYDVSVTNFGTWRSVTAAPRGARNPQTGQGFVCPSRREMRFRVSPRARDIVAAGDPAASRRKRSRGRRGPR